MEEEQPKELKLKDFQNTLLQGMLKTLITIPSLIKQSSNKILQYIVLFMIEISQK